MRSSFLWFASSCALLGCTEDRSAGGGGFETGDLHARVTTPAGKPAARAMVWLVRSNGDTAPATVLDSAWTDPSGLVRLTLASDVDRGGLGLDAKLGDSLGIVRRPFQHGDSAEVRLGKSGAVESWIDSARQIPTLFVPGSHFVSVRADSAPKSSLRIPQGDWDVALKASAKTEIVHDVRVGSVAATVGAPAWSTKNLIWTDSLVLDRVAINRIQYRDPNLPPVGSWSPLDSNLAGWTMSPELNGQEGGVALLGVGPTSKSTKSNGSGVSPPGLPGSGSLVISWQFDRSPESDSDLVRTIAIADSSGVGLRVDLNPRQKPSEWIVYSGSNQSMEAKLDPVDATHLSTIEWTISWDQKYFYLYAGKSYVGCAYRSTNGGLPRIRLGVHGLLTTTSGLVRIAAVKLYQPN
ncbi:MAG: hypothetical protein IPK50_03775 [Fibrobacterota bacterium]|nr:hypothetical protein [Fibrobacterota bacterium]QQS06014.1 MAG: hypothetical protein IPK50_03775 [Fibrobacterota bacterium]